MKFVKIRFNFRMFLMIVDDGTDFEINRRFLKI